MPERTLKPLSLDELIRRLDDRIRRLEQRTEIMIGVPPNAYLLSVNGAGQLVATNTTTGTPTVLAVP